MAHGWQVMTHTKPFSVVRYINASCCLAALSLLAGCTTVTTWPGTSVTAVSQRIDAAPNQGQWAFILTEGKGLQKRSHLVITDHQGQQAKVLYSITGSIFSLSASQDSQRLLFTQQVGKSYPLIYQLDITTRQATLLSPTTANNFGASFSPDGKRLLFSSSLHDNPEIYLAKVSDVGKVGQPLQLTFDPKADIAPVWMPDGRSFLFTSDRQGENRPQIYRYDFNTQHSELLTTQGSYNAVARVSPTADFITVIRTKGQGAVIHLPTRQQLTIDNQGVGEPINFAADGHTLIYAQYQQIFLQPVTLANEANLPTLRLGKRTTLDLSNTLLPFVTNADPADMASIHEPIWIPARAF